MRFSLNSLSVRFGSCLAVARSGRRASLLPCPSEVVRPLQGVLPSLRPPPPPPARFRLLGSIPGLPEEERVRRAEPGAEEEWKEKGGSGGRDGSETVRQEAEGRKSRAPPQPYPSKPCVRRAQHRSSARLASHGGSEDLNGSESVTAPLPEQLLDLKRLRGEVRVES